MDTHLSEKETALKRILEGYATVAVAFSGGVDSSLLLDVAHEVLGSRALALTACHVCLPNRERVAARTFCEERSIRHLEVPFDEFAVPGFSENPTNRCYLCKRELLAALLSTAKAQGIAVLAEGSNLDDLREYRPGRQAVEELGVVSPLMLAGFSKEDIRLLSKSRGLPTWNKPACACLATRLPYGTSLTPELITRIDQAEQYLLDRGAKQVRVRVHDTMARLELDSESIPLFLEEELRLQLNALLRALGFEFVTVDLQGYRTGSFDH